MKIKIFYSMSEDKLERLVNDFIAKKDIRITGLQFQATTFYFSVMCTYEPVMAAS